MSEVTPGLTVRGLRKVYQDRSQQVLAVDGVSFEIKEGAFYTLLGPSGCGKTTTLRCVAGLERHDAGVIQLGSEVLSSSETRSFQPPHKRDIGMVFQSYAIWPHMSVFDNVAFPLKASGARLSRESIKARVSEALSGVQLGGYEGRNATQLSGGQQQRLALARALVRRPRLLLLDEPLSNLDARLRDQMRSEIREIQRSLGITTMYVTHDQAEALSMSDVIAVLSGGRIVQEGPPDEIYRFPATRFVAEFVGSANFIEGIVLTTGNTATVRGPFGDFEAITRHQVSPGERVTVCVRPENVEHVNNDPPDRSNTFAGTVEHLSFLGEVFDARVRVGTFSLIVRAHPSSGIAEGHKVTLRLPPEACAVLRPENEEAATPDPNAIPTTPTH